MFPFSFHGTSHQYGVHIAKHIITTEKTRFACTHTLGTTNSWIAKKLKNYSIWFNRWASSMNFGYVSIGDWNENFDLSVAQSIETQPCVYRKTPHVISSHVIVSRMWNREIANNAVTVLSRSLIWWQHSLTLCYFCWITDPYSGLDRYSVCRMCNILHLNVWYAMYLRGNLFSARTVVFHYQSLKLKWSSFAIS